MSRNVTVLVIIVVFIFLAAYLILLRTRFATIQLPAITPTPAATPETVVPTVSGPAATTGADIASPGGSLKPTLSSGSAVYRSR